MKKSTRVAPDIKVEYSKTNAVDDWQTDAVPPRYNGVGTHPPRSDYSEVRYPRQVWLSFASCTVFRAGVRVQSLLIMPLPPLLHEKMHTPKVLQRSCLSNTEDKRILNCRHWTIVDLSLWRSTYWCHVLAFVTSIIYGKQYVYYKLVYTVILSLDYVGFKFFTGFIAKSNVKVSISENTKTYYFAVKISKIPPQTPLR